MTAPTFPIPACGTCPAAAGVYEQVHGELQAALAADRGIYLDVALVYALLSFLGVIVVALILFVGTRDGILDGVITGLDESYEAAQAPVALLPLVEDGVELYQAVAEEKGIDLELTESSPLASTTTRSRSTTCSRATIKSTSACEARSSVDRSVSPSMEKPKSASSEP